MTLDGSVHEAVVDANKNNEGEEPTLVFGQTVVCELLCFVQYFLNCSAPDNIKDIAGTFYTDDEILAAKRVLWCDNNKPFISKYADRRNTNQRTGAAANIDDIFTALSALDKLESVEKKIQYVAHNLTRLPSYNPEELNNVSMLQRINALERRYKSLENNISENYIEFNGLQRDVVTLTENLATNSTLIEEVAKKTNCTKKDRKDPIEDEEVDRESSTTNSSIQIESDEEKNLAEDDDNKYVTEEELSDSSDEEPSDVTDVTKKNPPRRQISGRIRPKRSVSRLRSQTIGRNPRRTNGSYRNRSLKHSITAPKRPNPHVTDQSKNGTSLQKETNETRRHHGGKTVTGTARGGLGKWGGVCGGTRPSNPLHRMDEQGYVTPREQWRKQQKHSEVFVFNVPKVVSTSDIKMFIKDKNVSVLDLFQRSHPDSRRKSFVLRVPSQQARQVMAASFWPASIKVRGYASRD